MRRMKHRVEAALRQHPVRDWTERLHGQRWDNAWRIGHMSQEAWPKIAAAWNPLDVPDQFAHIIPHRGRGRPRTRWDDTLIDFCQDHMGHPSWHQAAAELTATAWNAAREEYIMYCNGL